MKMRSYRSRNALLSGATWPVAALLFGVVGIVVLLRLFAPGALTVIASPLWRAGDMATGAVGVPLAGFASNEQLRADNERLAEEQSVLQAEVAALKTRLADLGAPTEVASGIKAGVLARPPVSPYDTLILAGGGEEGVSVGSRVYAQGVIPIGVIESVSARSSRAVLYSESGRMTEGWVGESRNPITLTGESAGAFSAIVPRESALIEGEAVYLPGPGALPIGYIVRIDRNPSSPEARVHVRPVVNPFSLTWVTIDASSYE